MRENYHDRIISVYFLNCVKGPEYHLSKITCAELFYE